MVVWTTPGNTQGVLRSRGMIRLINVEKVLSTLAKRHPEIQQIIRVHDKLITPNNGIYYLHNGHCEPFESTTHNITLDVSVDVLTKILFSSEKIGKIFDIQASHPMLALMLD